MIKTIIPNNHPQLSFGSSPNTLPYVHGYIKEAAPGANGIQGKPILEVELSAVTKPCANVTVVRLISFTDNSVRNLKVTKVKTFAKASFASEADIAPKV